MKIKQSKKLYIGVAVLVALVGIFAVRNILLNKSQAAKQPMVVEVKAMQVIQQDTPITYEYVGQVQAKQEVKLQSKVSGNIVAKMVNGGAMVTKGQPLFQIDRRQYDAASLSAQAQLAQAQATLANSRKDTERYRQLVEQGGVAQQTYDNVATAERQYAAAVDANAANVQKAEADASDTLIVAPIDGRIDINDLAAGNFVAAGSTVIATISSLDPVYVQFSVNENEYLKLAQAGNGNMPGTWGGNLKLLLSNGAEYPLTGQVEQIDRGINQNTGTLSLKAAFANPQNLLLPGMFARVVAQGEIRKNAILVPQRAVQEMLDKTFITVLVDGNTAESRPVKMGARIGNMWIVEEGLSPQDVVVVEGAAKIQKVIPLKITMIGLNDLQSSAK
jgi:membrane fusion protein (multidrug efflux system)